MIDRRQAEAPHRLTEILLHLRARGDPGAVAARFARWAHAHHDAMFNDSHTLSLEGS